MTEEMEIAHCSFSHSSVLFQRGGEGGIPNGQSTINICIKNIPVPVLVLVLFRFFLHSVFTMSSHHLLVKVKASVMVMCAGRPQTSPETNRQRAGGKTLDSV